MDLLKGRILRSLIIFAIPLFISSIFQQLYNTVDVMIVGNYLGDTSLAAIGASAAVYELLVGFSLRRREWIKYCYSKKLWIK